MKIKFAFQTALLVYLIGLSGTGAIAADRPYTVSLGFLVFSDFADNESEDYPGASFSMPYSLSIKDDDLRWRISSSYLVQVDNGATYSGFGDTSAGVSWDANDWLSLSYRHKFATGDESNGFSTGEDDDSIGIETFHILTRKTSLFTALGYKFVGKGNRTDRQDAASAGIGLGYVVDPGFNLMVSVDYYETSYTTSSDTSALTVMGSHKITSQTRVGWFVGSDSDDVYSAGTNISYSF